MSSFKQRVHEEVKQLIVDSKRDGGANSKKNPEKSDRRKEYLKNKKKKKKGNRSIDYDDEDNYGNSDSAADTFVTGERAVAVMAASSSTASARNATPIGLNDQVERPPIFNLLPRGANKLSKKKRSDNYNEDGNTGDGNGKKKRSSMNESQIAAEHNAMEVMRRKVQAQYALVKAQRKRDGDFHL